MRKIFLFLSLSFSVCAMAQVKKDTWLLGGQFSFGLNKSSSANDDQKGSSSFFQVSAGKALRDNRVFGGQISLGFSSQDFSNGFEDGTQRSNSYGAGVFYRFYKNLGKDFYFLGQTNLDFSVGNGDWIFNSSTDDFKFKNFRGNLSVTPGLAYALFPRFHIELTLPALFGINHYRETTTYTNSTTPERVYKSFGAFTSLNSNNGAGILGVGFRVLL
jgi:hypothetical protein